MKIKDMPESTRPRERLLSLGPSSLTDAELLALFLRTGTKKRSAIQLAADMLEHFGGLQELLSTTPAKTSEFPGIGEAKAAQLHAILEIGKRYLTQNHPSKQKLGSSTATKAYLSLALANKQSEVFACLYLDAKHQILGYEELFQGSNRESSVYIGTVVKQALAHNAVHVICAHNHPSGDPTPSQADINLTKQLKSALSLVDIKLIDHIIVAKGATPYSFADLSPTGLVFDGDFL